LTASDHENPREPLVVVADDGPSLFPSVATLGSYIEAPDVDDGVCRGFDGEGRLLKIETTHHPAPPTRLGRLMRRVLGPPQDLVMVSLAESAPTHRAELRKMLIDGLSRRMGQQASTLEAESLAQLLRLAEDHLLH